jgi:hypothetical protein
MNTRPPIGTVVERGGGQAVVVPSNPHMPAGEVALMLLPGGEFVTDLVANVDVPEPTSVPVLACGACLVAAGQSRDANAVEPALTVLDGTALCPRHAAEVLAERVESQRAEPDSADVVSHPADRTAHYHTVPVIPGQPHTHHVAVDDDWSRALPWTHTHGDDGWSV